jgi:hypothetical protein
MSENEKRATAPKKELRGDRKEAEQKFFGPLTNRFVVDPIEISIDNSQAEGEPFDLSVNDDA